MYPLALGKLLSQFERLKNLGPNEQGKDYFVGNLCGQYAGLERAMHKAGFNPYQDRLFTVGNLIDYGQDSLKVLALLNRPWFYPVLGIHELIMLDALQSGHYLNWYTEGGQWAFDDNIGLKYPLEKASKALLKLPLAYLITQKKGHKIGVISSFSPKHFSAEAFAKANLNTLFRCLTCQDAPKQKTTFHQEVDVIVCGGPPAKAPWARGNVVGLNTGAHFLPEKGKLALFKRKKLLKLIEKQSSFSAF
ncbi:hypothetical protein P2G88_07740 [Aliiglaciecola sp. CAU 1673]|uniref:hypothetical protein n=1 Tax=Aliiglaciecola sp. CAU 1673 TaxID=3032595 RepID=UPI0023DB1E86|nr:hypothetical protein [Aliiglaciecola sp. CAU 1673]MDF2178142.1 hypothetical protein [Aliiglaciecola sp. CAU 1673]